MSRLWPLPRSPHGRQDRLQQETDPGRHATAHLETLRDHVQHEGDVIARELQHGLDEHDAQALDIHSIWGEAVQPKQRKAALQGVVIQAALQDLQGLVPSDCICKICRASERKLSAHLLLKLGLQLW